VDTSLKSRMNQYKWDGHDNVSNIFMYSHSLGPRDTMQNTVSVMQISKQDAEMLVQLYRLVNASVVIPEAITTASVDSIRNQLISKIDAFMSTLPGDTKWFVKTNRHSCKDSPLDHPLPSDLQLFTGVLSEFDMPPLDVSLDDLDFGPCFEAMCRARLHATAVTNGTMVVSLLERSRRIHDDFTLQLEYCPDPWDCYIAFSPFCDTMARYPLHEFRCYISRRKLRCISQYSYLVTCPIASALMPDAVRAMARCVEEEIIPTLDASIIDAAVDIQCVPANTSENGVIGHNLSHFAVSVIEVNPLGPGTVWGHLHWESDKRWLLGDNFEVNAEAEQEGEDGDSSGVHSRGACILPRPRRVLDSAGNEKIVQWYRRTLSSHCNTTTIPLHALVSEHRYELVDCGVDYGVCLSEYQINKEILQTLSPNIAVGRDPSSLLMETSSAKHDEVTSDGGNVVVVLFTSNHPRGMELGALAHIPSDYLLQVWEQWRIEERPGLASVAEHNGTVDSSTTSTSTSMMDYCVIM
jgi:hypothetical protein